MATIPGEIASITANASNSQLAFSIINDLGITITHQNSCKDSYSSQGVISKGVMNERYRTAADTELAGEGIHAHGSVTNVSAETHLGRFRHTVSEQEVKVI